jgi:hypothetical protein
MATSIEPRAAPTGGRWAGIRHAIKVNTSLRIDPEVFMLAKVAAELKGLSLNVYFERAIQEATARDVPADHPARVEER